MLLYCSAFLLQWYCTAVLLCCSDIVLLCYRAAVILYCNATVLLCSSFKKFHTYRHTYIHTEPLLEVLADLKMEWSMKQSECPCTLYWPVVEPTSHFPRKSQRRFIVLKFSHSQDNNILLFTLSRHRWWYFSCVGEYYLLSHLQPSRTLHDGKLVEPSRQ